MTILPYKTQRRSPSPPTAPYDALSSVDVTAAQMLTGYQGWVSGTKITGTMANNGQISATITGVFFVAGTDITVVY